MSSAKPTRSREATCNAILDATGQVIAEEGVQAFTMSKVAKRAKVNRALIYHYYHDRSNLISQTAQHIVNRYEHMRPALGENDVEHDLRLYIQHPEIARFMLHLILSGTPVLRLSRRTVYEIEEFEGLKTLSKLAAAFDPAFVVISAWLVQLAWGATRDEVARLLGLSLEEADRRFIANMRRTSLLMRRLLTGVEAIVG